VIYAKILFFVTVKLGANSSVLHLYIIFMLSTVFVNY